MTKSSARDQIPAPVVTPPTSIVEPSIVELLKKAEAKQAEDEAKARAIPVTGPSAARELALAAAGLCAGNMQPSTLIQARRLLKLALVNLDG